MASDIPISTLRGIHPVRRVSLREVTAPVARPDEAAARDRIWDDAVGQNPTLFDGPVALMADLAWDGADELKLDWARGTYRNFALRRVPGATTWLPSLFVAVLQPTTDGRAIAGQMGGSTAAPGRWQFPGGTVDPPPAGQPLTLDDLRSHAALELREEIGIDVPSEHLQLWLAIGADKGNVGLLFTAPPLDAEQITQHYEALCTAEAVRGIQPEFSRIQGVGVADLPGLDRRVEYLDEVIRLQAAQVR